MAESPIEWLRIRIKDNGDRSFIVHRGLTAGYHKLLQEIESSSIKLERANVEPGSVVGLPGDFSLVSTAALLALAFRNCIAVPVANGLADDQLKLRWHEANVEWIWNGDPAAEPALQKCAATSRHPLVQQLVDRKSAGLILFSSGSAGKPKAMVQDLSKLINVFQSRKARKLNILSFLLFDHIGGINTLLNTIASGALLVVPDDRNPETIARLIEKTSVNLLPTSPTFLNLLLMSGAHERFDLGSLKIISYGTEPMPTGLLSRLKSAFPWTRLLQTFGTSETGISQTVSLSSESTLMKFDDPNLEHKIVAGELWLRSATQIQGYLNCTNERFTDDGWFKTGDQAEQSDEGFFRIVGRRSELINVGGEKVTPSEVEGVLLEIPEILDCLVYGEANSITGQSVSADLVLDALSEPHTIKRLVRQFCRQRLEPYKIPSRIKVVPQTEFSDRFKKKRQSSN